MGLTEQEQNQLLQNQKDADYVCKAATSIGYINHPSPTWARTLRAEAVNRHPEHLQDRIRAQVILNFERKKAKK